MRKSRNGTPLDVEGEPNVGTPGSSWCCESERKRATGNGSRRRAWIMWARVGVVGLEVLHG